jgi:hypothetical protein
VEIVNQVLALPLAYVWLPGLVFIMVVGGVFWVSRPGTDNAVDSSVKQAALTAVGTEKPKDQRGTFRRQGNPVEVYVATPETKEQPAIGSVLDRSMGGMRLAIFRAVEVGSVISIRPVSADSIVPWVDLEIRSCGPSTEIPGQFEVGCQYVKSPPYSIQLLFG